MTGPEKYRAGYLDSLERKLFILRDSDGTPNPELSKVIRRMQREMGSQEAFVGLVPFGSSALGYGTRERHGEHHAQSDIDFALLYDSSLNSNVEKKLGRIKDSEHRKYVAEEKNAYPTHMPGTDRYDLNSELMDRAFANPHETPPKEHVRIARAVALLGMLAVGPGVDEYRRLIGKKINMIPDEYRRSFLNTVLREILDTEQSKEKGESKTKMESRMFPHMVPERVSQMRQVRRAMWADRLRKVYGLKEEL